MQILRWRRRARVLIVPDQWSGSVQQYYHFLLGYLAPILAWIDRTHTHEITVRDCGPMNRWLDVLDGVADVEILTPGDALHVFAGRRQPSVVLRGLDYPDEFSPRAIAAFRQRMFDLLDVADAPPGPLVVATDRATSDDFYHSSVAEVPMSGAERRSVPNLANIAATWQMRFGAQLVDTAQLGPREQLAIHRTARVLVGQHGAGLTNMIWMQPGGTVVEIHPPLPDDAVNTFRLLANACGHVYVTVPQAGVHAPVDAAALTDAVASAYARYA